jgi:phage/plasmid-associated DNA primase
MDDNTIIRLSELQERGTLKPDCEDALALIFAERYAEELRYVAMWGKWLRYDGTCWHYDDTLHVFDMVRDVCRDARNSAPAILGILGSDHER